MELDRYRSLQTHYGRKRQRAGQQIMRVTQIEHLGKAKGLADDKIVETCKNISKVANQTTPKGEISHFCGGGNAKEAPNATHIS